MLFLNCSHCILPSDDFLCIQDINHNTDYQTFKKKWGNDPRFEALDRKERDALFNERYKLFILTPAEESLPWLSFLFVQTACMLWKTIEP